MDNDKDHFFMTVEVGDGAAHFITNPNAEPHLQWMLRYGRQFGNDLQTAEMAAATVLSGFDYLLSDNINLKEATRRLGLMRKAHQAAITQPKG
jgi:hypothetical protein